MREDITSGGFCQEGENGLWIKASLLRILPLDIYYTSIYNNCCMELSQFDALHRVFKQDKWIAENYNLENWEEVANIFEDITEKQRKYIWALLYQKDYKSLKQIFNQLGFLEKKYATSKTTH